MGSSRGTTIETSARQLPIIGQSVDNRGRYLSRPISELTIDPRAMTAPDFHLQQRPEEAGERDKTARIAPGISPLGVLMPTEDYTRIMSNLPNAKLRGESD
jgi:hypothetical protein